MREFLELMNAGLMALREYIALHVLTCLIPAFLLAGAMVTFVSKEAIVRTMGAAAGRLRSFSLAAGGSFFVAACSCTVIPVASGLYYGGAGVGPAFILLWVAPAANVLALVYTGAILGGQMALVRLISALLLAFVVGWVMTLVFLREEHRRARELGLSAAASSTESAEPSRSSAESVGIVASSTPTPAASERGPKLMEGRDVVLLLLLVVALLAPNYLVQHGPYLHKVYVWAAGMMAAFAYAFWAKPLSEIQRWMRETWWFVRLIFPLLLLGVFIVGIIGAVLPEAWIRHWLGGSGLLSSFLATLIGGISYFATMTEAPFVHKLMELGMGPGPALALLLTGPGISLPNWLAIARVFGLKKALVYVPTVMILGTLVGWIAGNTIFSP